MKRILVIGAGLSSTSLINYLLKESEKFNWKVVIADLDEDLAKRKAKNHKNASVLKFNIFDEQQRLKEIENSDVVISMLRAKFHPIVAEDCLATSTHMITASYVSKDMQSFDEIAKRKGIALLNELGVDPGIDHMSAMKIIDAIKNEGGKMISFKSNTGGLIAPEFDNNPWHYKFTWNPRNVVLAGQGNAMFIRNGKLKYIPYHQLFRRTLTTTVLDYGEFEIYANRDSLSYRGIYGLEDIPTMFRGTLRRPGYCEAWNAFVQLGITDDTYIIENSDKLTYRDFINAYLRYDPIKPVEEKFCDYLNIEPKSETYKKIEWLEIFTDKKIKLSQATPAQILQDLLEEKWALGEKDKDMIVMQHEFEYEQNGKKKGIRSSLVVKGKDKDNTAMAITVGTPVAIAAKMLLTGVIDVKGVHRPIIPELYVPIMEELAEYGIEFIEEEYEPKE
ncbi:MAG: saccharopine dehydrogenase C-terminal domain-containing protein [Marinilabiliales bacterium]